MRYRSLLFLSFVLFSLAACKTNKNKFTVIGDIANMPGHTALLQEMRINEIRVIDSAKSDDKGHFELTGTTDEAGLFRVWFDKDHMVLLSVDKGNVKVTGNWDHLSDYTVAGSAGSQSMKHFLEGINGYNRDINTMFFIIDTLKKKGNDSMTTAAEKKMDDIKFQLTRYTEMYADTTQYLPVAVFCALWLDPSVEKDFLMAFTQGLSRRFPNAQLAKDFEKAYGKAVAAAEEPAAQSGPAIGTSAPEINLPDVNGKQVRLSSFKGKYVLVDFWASWCGPCRHENPNVVAAYNKFKDKNFTVFGVSLDKKKENWEDAIKNDGLVWTQVSDLKFWQSEAAVTYDIQSIPSNFLLDPSGKIIARDLRGEELENKLQQLLK